MSGPTMPDGFAMSMKRIRPRQIEYVFKHRAKPIAEGVITVAADGRTLTDESWPVGMKQETTTAVYEK
jgi:hypothetical protein